MATELRMIRPEDIKNDLITYFRGNSLIPIVGSGISCGAGAGKGTVPSGSQYRRHMIDTLKANPEFSDDEKAAFESDTFSAICDYYEDDDNVEPDVRWRYMKANFYGAALEEGDYRRELFAIDWPYIYSLNLDDAIENSSAYTTLVLPNREPRESLFKEEKCLIKLHGDIKEIVTYKKADKIFTSKEYALSLEKNAPLLNKLRNDYAYQNILFIGCSLDDEIDLQTLTDLPLDYEAGEGLNKRIIFVQGTPGKREKSKFKKYGITDVVCFDTFRQMYTLLGQAWEESKKIQKTELSSYENIHMLELKSAQKKENQEFFFWGKSLFDSKAGTLRYPYYFISRDLAGEISRKLSQNKVHLIYGGRISGKTYLLADLYRMIRDRAVYYFDGRSRLSAEALQNLLSRKKCVSLFDIGALDREQFEYILSQARLINQNGSNCIIALNFNDSDTLGIVKWKLREGHIDSSDIISYTLDNRLKKTAKTVGQASEIQRINGLLPVVNLLPFDEERTLLDQLIYAEKKLQVSGQFSRQHLKVETCRQLALLIVMVIKEKMYSSDVVNFALDQEMGDALRKYAPFIERIETDKTEKDAADLSSVKYVLNSKYWLRRELGDFARSRDHYGMIAEAYRYIIRKITEFSGSDENRRRKSCMNYILFDVMNDTFLDEHNGNLNLIVYLYSQLHELLAQDYNFLHQNAKCYINYSYTLKSDKEKKQYLQDAKQLALVSKSMIEDRYKKSGNARLLIANAHVDYTIATVRGDLCKLADYKDIDDVEETIRLVHDAAMSAYNTDDYKRERMARNSRGIVNFVKQVYDRAADLGIKEPYLSTLTSLREDLIIRKRTGRKQP